MYALTAGTSLLVYQLRRYRNDDFLGHYRLWRLVLVVCLLASVDSSVGLVEWGGAAIDLAFGRRVALGGGDWLSLLLTFGGVIFAIRLVLEVRRSRASLPLMLIGWAWLAVPAAVRWNLFRIESTTGGWLVTTAPLMACACFWTSVTSYLRLLLRQVRQLEDDLSPMARLRDYVIRLPVVRSESSAGDREASLSWRERRAAKREDRFAKAQKSSARKLAPPESSDTKPRRTKGRWFGRRGATPQEKAVDAPAVVDAKAAPLPTEGSATDVDEPTPPQRGGGLRGWLGKGKTPAPRHEQADDVVTTPPGPESSIDRSGRDSDQNADENDAQLDENDIDWANLSKAEK